ncbi:MAG: DUF4142 domain-containing protein [Deltaproteobacteria bacterium]|nr:DUF4142 domain-containing protein [Deltaproteobacteria bacterium]
MFKNKLDAVTMTLLAATVTGFGLMPDAIGDVAKKQQVTVPAAKVTIARDEVEKVIRSWAPGPQLAAQEMMAKYGGPQEVTSERLIWRAAGPFKRITLTREELPHDFPMPHMDYLEHTIAFNVPVDKSDEVHAFGASLTIYRVGGELSARCDLESNNVLTFNLANDVIAGKKTVADARKEFGDIVLQRTLGKDPAYAKGLQFQPQTLAVAASRETVTMPGAAKRVDAGMTKAGGDAEIMAMLTTVDLDEVHAASVAKTKKVGGPVMEYARMIHERHGKDVEDTAKLAVIIGVTPLQTPAVRALHEKHAAALARIVPLEGDAFASAYLELMVNGHTETLQLLDRQLRAAKNKALKAHLTSVRGIVAGHLTEAKRLRTDATQTSSR